MQRILRSTLLPLGTILLTGAAIAAVEPAFASGFDVYLSAPGSTSTLYTSTLTETFEEFTTGTKTSNLVGPVGFGTYLLSSTAKLAVVADDQYGTGTGHYAALGNQSGSSAPVTLQLTTPQSYFGFSWNAGDRNNTLTFYNGSQVVGYYSTATVTGLLKNATILDVHGDTYQSSAYYGKPGSGPPRSNVNEPYAFMNFLDNTGTFDKVVFGNSNTTGTGFESDNHTIRFDAPAPDQSFVYVGSAVPEPGTMALLIGIGLSGSVFLRRKRTRK